MVASPLTLAAIAAVATACAGIALALVRRRSSRPRPLDLRPRRLDLRSGPAGVRHLATRVSELSDKGLHLPPRTDALHGKHRLGALLGLR